MNAKQRQELLENLKVRFERHSSRHHGLAWAPIQTRLEADAEKPLSALRALHEMERTGGEPDVVGRDETTGAYLFVDCSAESPTGRRSLCYDRAAWEARKQHRPSGNALEMAAAMGVEILSEAEYRQLQRLGAFDAKSSSWVRTPPEIRRLGGALFCDRRYDQVFVYHNGADSYYAARGFRASRRV